MVLEIVGYVGSFLVVISMLMSSIVKLRVINTIGSVISGVYAVICGALPLALMNLCLIVINLINLFKLLGKKPPYELVEAQGSDALVRYFEKTYREDIRRYFPDFAGAEADGDAAFVTCCEGTPVGLLLGRREGETLELAADYTTPAYRDCSVGRYLHDELPKSGVSRLRYTQKLTEEHRAYLEKMGYTPQDGAWVLELG